MAEKIIVIDEGTTSTRTMLFGADGTPLGSAQREFRQYYPGPGLVEHDAAEIWEATLACTRAMVEEAGGAAEIAAIGITNQRETCLFWDAETGEAIHRALVWQDRRTADFCKDLQAAGHEPDVRSKTGLVLDPYFSGTKAKWLLDHVEGARDRAARGELLFGTIDTWLAWRLCGAHATDPSNASRTLLFNINTMDWDDSLLELSLIHI